MKTAEQIIALEKVRDELSSLLSASVAGKQVDNARLESLYAQEVALSRDYFNDVGVGVASQLGSGFATGGRPPMTNVNLGRMIQCSILGDLDHKAPRDIAANLFPGAQLGSIGMTANDHSAGGAWISGSFSKELIDQLYPFSVVRMIGSRVPLDDGTLTIPKLTAGPSGTYLGETEDASIESLATGDVKLIAKELVVLVLSSEKLLRSPSADASSRILQAILSGAGATEDLYFLRGSDSGAGPTGLRYLVDAANVIAMNATVNLANITNDLGRLEYLILGANIRMARGAWIMNPRTLIYLMDLRDGNGGLAFPGLQGAQPRLRNKPVYTTTQIPTNLGGGTESEIYLVDGTHVLIGDAPKIAIQSSNVATYQDGATQKSAFSNRKVLTRLIVENDLALEHDKAVAVLTGVTWGA